MLSDSNIAFSIKKHSIDIYSFGMVLWELFSLAVPFAENIEAAKLFVVDKNFRPKIKTQGD